MSAETKPQWDRYTAALPSIAAAVGRTPLVRLNRVTRDVKPAIYVKVEWYGATGSLKDRIYLHMFERAERAAISSRACACSSARPATPASPARGWPR